MRCFIGLDLHSTEKLALDSWRQQALPEVTARNMFNLSEGRAHNEGRGSEGRRSKGKESKGKRRDSGASQPYAVNAANYHMTLSFLGHITHRQHEALVAELDMLVHAPFSLTLDTTGIWNGPKILFAAPQSPPAELMALAKSTRKAARAAAIEVDGKAFSPHVTVIRKATAALPVPLYTPHIEMHASAFHLFESVSTPQGVTYPVRQSWNLKHNMSVREKLRRGINDE